MAGLALISQARSMGEQDMSKQLYFQSITVGNGGQDFIVNPQIYFDDVSLINKSQTRFRPPPSKEGWKGIASMVTESMDLPIPDFAKVTWQSSDNHDHFVSVPLRKFVRDKSLFYGFHFVFRDNAIDVYLVEKKQFKVPTHTLETVESKIFSSDNL